MRPDYGYEQQFRLREIIATYRLDQVLGKRDSDGDEKNISKEPSIDLKGREVCAAS